MNKVMNKGKFKWLAESNNGGKTFMERLANLNCTKVSEVCDYYYFCIFCCVVSDVHILQSCEKLQGETYNTAQATKKIED